MLTVRVTVPMVAPDESLTVPVSTPVASRFPFRVENFAGVKLPAKEPLSAVPVIGVARAVTGVGAAGALGAALATPAPAKLSPNAASTVTTIIDSRCRCVIVPPADSDPSGLRCHRQASLPTGARPSERCHRLTVSGVSETADTCHVCRSWIAGSGPREDPPVPDQLPVVVRIDRAEGQLQQRTCRLRRARRRADIPPKGRRRCI